MNPRVGDVVHYHGADPDSPDNTYVVKGVSENEVNVDLHGMVFGFSWRTFRSMFVTDAEVRA